MAEGSRMWAISLLTILLLPLLSAAPLNIASDNDGMHSHDENVTRSGKFFGHNQFDVGNINISGSVAGDDVSIGHQVKIDVYGHIHDHHHQEDDTVIECKEGLSALFKSIDSNKNGLMDANELLRVCHQNKIQIPESLAARILTIPDKTVVFNLAMFCELLKDCPSTNSEDIISFLLELFDKGFYGDGPTTTTVSPVLTTPSAVTCPYKEDLSSVLLENNWRTQNEINEMSEEDKRNTVIAEVEQMTGHTTADLQRRDNTGDLGSLTSIANMAAFLIKYFIKSSSDVKTMRYEPDLRNTLIIETSRRCSIEVGTLKSKTDHQLLKTFFEKGGRCGQCSCGRTDAAPHVRRSRVEHLEASCVVNVGSSIDSKTKYAKVSEGCVCPVVVNKDIFIPTLKSNRYEFKVTQDGSSLHVERTDSDVGWDLNLSFECNADRLQKGQRLLGDQNESLRSLDGEYDLVMQSDGNLVIYRNHNNGRTATYETGTFSEAGSYLKFQDDGNLVIYREDRKVLWATNILSNSADSLRMENDGNLVIYAANNKIWASDKGDLISQIVNNFKKVGSDSLRLPEIGMDIKLDKGEVLVGRSSYIHRDDPEAGIDIKGKVYNGKLTGLRNMNRIGTSCFDIYSADTARVTGKLRLDNLQAHYKVMTDTKAMTGILCDFLRWCPEYSIDVKIKSVTLYLKVEFEIMPGSKRPTYTTLWVDDIGEISVDGTPILKNSVESNIRHFFINIDLVHYYHWYDWDLQITIGELIKSLFQ